MSAIIGICSTQFCLLVADRRLVSIQNASTVVANDDTDKIFKINNDLIYGATGVFVDGEDFLEPLKCFSSFENITLDMALNAIKDYTICNFQMIDSCNARNYILGGKQDSKYYMCIIHYNGKIKKFEFESYCSSGDTIKYQLILPPNAVPFENQLRAEMSDMFDKAKTIEALIIESGKLITKIATIDDSVGNTMNYVIV